MEVILVSMEIALKDIELDILGSLLDRTDDI